MKIITLTDFLDNKRFYLSEAKTNKIFVYPTDTIYGIGAIVSKDNEAKIFTIKHRDTKKMFSIIAPDFEWIKEKYQLREAQYDALQEYVEKYHGVTYIFDYTKPGVRIIKHPFQQFVEALKMPFITTSCNISGEPAILEKISQKR